MDGLRWILLALGVAVIVVVYFISRRPSGGVRAIDAPAAEPETFSAPTDEPDEASLREELARMQTLVGEQRDETTPPRDAEQLIVVSVMAPAAAPFTGAALEQAFAHCGLIYDAQQRVYHRLVVDGDPAQPVFSVANAVNPGLFERADMAAFSSPGVSLILQLPGPVDGVQAFDDMINTAGRLAAELGGELQDHQHSALSRQTVAHLRERIIDARVHVPARTPA